MLEGLDKIDWSKVSTPYGANPEIPQWIRELSSTQPNVREAAWENLTQHIWHQGDFWDSGKAIAPFLIELLQDKEIQSKENIIQILIKLATEYHFPTWVEELGHPPELLNRLKYRQNTTLEFETYQIVSDGIDVYLGLLEHPDPIVRAQAVCLLGYFSKQTNKIAPKLFEFVSYENKREVILCVLLSLGTIAEPKPAYIAFFKRFFKDNDFKIASAIALAKILRDETPSEVVELLISIAKDPSNSYYFNEFKCYPELGLQDLAGDKWSILRYLGPRYSEQIIQALLPKLEKADDSEYNLAVTLVHLAFNNQEISKKTRPEDLTETQMAVLVTLANNDNLWGSSEDLDGIELKEFDNPNYEEFEAFLEPAFDILSSYGIPYNRKKLRSFLRKK